MRETKETKIEVRFQKGSGEADIQISGALESSEPGAPEGRVAFVSHMLTTLAKYSGYAISVQAESKDGLMHHLLEDVAICLGQAIRDAVDVNAIERMDHRVVPMDDALVMVALDLVNRPYYEGPLPDAVLDHMLRSISMEGGLTLHVNVLRGSDPHHIIEASFKGLGLCLARATMPRDSVLSTKGEVQ